MARLEYFLVSEGVSVDQSSNRVSYFNVLENYRANAFPISIPHLVAASAWNAEGGDVGQDFQATLLIHIQGNDDPISFPLNFTMRNSRHRIFHNLVNLVIPEPGEIGFEIMLNDNHAATHTISVSNL